MELCFCLLFFTTVYVAVLGRIDYHTEPLPRPTRVTKHVPKVISKTCYLLPQRGPCRANIKMYYYDTEKKNCTKFRWGGCQGNGNRFDTHNECMTTCLSRPNMTATKPKFCQLSFDYGFCFGAIQRWYYDKFWKVCKETIYSGCGGNQNNFYTMDKCHEVCVQKGYSKRTTEHPDSTKKILIVNPPEATSNRGLEQSNRKTKSIKTSNRTTKPTVKKMRSNKTKEEENDINNADFLDEFKKKFHKGQKIESFKDGTGKLNLLRKD